MGYLSTSNQSWQLEYNSQYQSLGHTLPFIITNTPRHQCGVVTVVVVAAVADGVVWLAVTQTPHYQCGVVTVVVVAAVTDGVV